MKLLDKNQSNAGRLKLASRPLFLALWGTLALAGSLPLEAAARADSQPAEDTDTSSKPAQLAQGQEETASESTAPLFRSEEEDRRGRIFLGSEFFTLSLGGGKRFSATGLGVGGSFGLSDKFAVFADSLQTLSPRDKDASLFTAFSVGTSYALSGLFTSKTVVISDGKQELARYHEAASGGFRISIGLSQYFFNAGSSSLSYSGLSGDLSYDYPVTEDFGFSLGVGAEHLSNGTTLILPERAFLRLWKDLQ